MSAVDRTLAASSPASEYALSGPDTWAAYHTATNAALSCKHAGVAGQQHFIRQIVVTADAATAAVNALTINDGTNTIFAASLPTTLDASPFVVTFPGAGLPGQVGADVTLAMTSTGNSANGTIWMAGYTQKAP
jgi:hypothetical protein